MKRNQIKNKEIYQLTFPSAICPVQLMRKLETSSVVPVLCV